MRKRANKLKWYQIIARILAGILCFLLFLYCFSGICNAINNAVRNKYAKNVDAVAYAEGEQKEPYFVKTDDDYGYWIFQTYGSSFKVVQLTDVHIGGGYWSISRDKKAITAVSIMLQEEKPDLVVVTGDVAYPVPFQAGTLNNRAASKTFALLMEELGVYWTICFGNHDTEAYSYYTREKIYKFYTQEEDGKRVYPHCLLHDTSGDVSGYGNQVIKVINQEGLVTHAIVTIDSHDYLPDDPFGAKWHYDYIKDDQIEWYKKEIDKINYENKLIDPSASNVTSTAYFHIPLVEMRDAYETLRDSGVTTFKNDGQSLNLTTGAGNNITYFEGSFGEDPDKKMVYSSDVRTAMFKAMKDYGTKAIFFGHDHTNNARVTMDGVDLVYGMSIDYLAYTKLTKYGRQRGCTEINISGTGDITSINLKNYYTDFNAPEKEKNKVSMGSLY